MHKELKENKPSDVGDLVLCDVCFSQLSLAWLDSWLNFPPVLCHQNSDENNNKIQLQLLFIVQNNIQGDIEANLQKTIGTEDLSAFL